MHRSELSSGTGFEDRRKKFPNLLFPKLAKFSVRFGIPAKSESTDIRFATDSSPVPSGFSSPRGFGGTDSETSSILSRSSEVAIRMRVLGPRNKITIVSATYTSEIKGNEREIFAH